MLCVISPAKKLDLEPIALGEYSQPQLLDEAQELLSQMQSLTAPDLKSLMGISDALAELNYERYHNMQFPFTRENAKQALFAFKGDVYAKMDPASFDNDDIAFVKDHLRILSGFYGILRPLDLMQAYRLEMGTKLKNTRGKDLYQFWKDSIVQLLNDELDRLGDDTLINLASNEYFSAIDQSQLKAQKIDITFKEDKNGTYKIIGINAKRARGLMVRYIVKNRLSDVEKLKEFNVDNYRFSSDFSSDGEYVFVR
ncbi:MAG: peroxide stress protein YaaA [Rickettsiales bacterium]|nr:peroxide stress protein YaaA [Rickettsiales bacterium]